MMTKQCHLLLMFYSTIGNKELKDWVNIDPQKEENYLEILLSWHNVLYL